MKLIKDNITIYENDDMNNYKRYYINFFKYINEKVNINFFKYMKQ